MQPQGLVGVLVMMCGEPKELRIARSEEVTTRNPIRKCGACNARIDLRDCPKGRPGRLEDMVVLLTDGETAVYLCNAVCDADYCSSTEEKVVQPTNIDVPEMQPAQA